MAISLSNITGGQSIRPPKITVYGVGGIGKTTFASMAPKPIFLPTEDGIGLLDVKRFEFEREGGRKDAIIRSWQELLDCVSALCTGKHDYQTVVVDTLDFAEPLLWKHTAEKYSKPDIEDFGYGKGYVYAVDEARSLLAGLDMLRDQRGMSIILLAHSDTKKYDAPDHEPYDRYKLRLHDRLGNLVHDWSDALLFANWRSHIVKDVKGSGKSKKETARGVGQGERVMYTEERPAWWAKNRYRLPLELPMNWEAFQGAVAASVAASNPKQAIRPKEDKQDGKN